ncbi:MAG: DUF3460 family protein [Ferruginibacter sp.]|nr:DUF3460 family protein [Rhodoferax sp.]
MSIFRRPDYTSETTQFIEQLKVQNPNLEAEHLAGRALLWEPRVDRSAQEEYREGRVAQTSYVYQTNNR